MKNKKYKVGDIRGKAIYDYHHLEEWAISQGKDTRRLKKKWKEAMKYARVLESHGKIGGKGKGRLQRFVFQFLKLAMEQKKRLNRIDYHAMKRVYDISESQPEFRNDLGRLDRFMQFYGDEWYNGLTMRDWWEVWKDFKISNDKFFEILRDFQSTNEEYKKRMPFYKAIEFAD